MSAFPLNELTLSSSAQTFETYRTRSLCNGVASSNLEPRVRQLTQVGFSDLFPKFLRANGDHRSASSSRQRVDHPPPPPGRTGSLGSFGSCPPVPQPRGRSSG